MYYHGTNFNAIKMIYDSGFVMSSGATCFFFAGKSAAREYTLGGLFVRPCGVVVVARPYFEVVVPDDSGNFEGFLTSSIGKCHRYVKQTGGCYWLPKKANGKLDWEEMKGFFLINRCFIEEKGVGSMHDLQSLTEVLRDPCKMCLIEFAPSKSSNTFSSGLLPSPVGRCRCVHATRRRPQSCRVPVVADHRLLIGQHQVGVGGKAFIILA